MAVPRAEFLLAIPLELFRVRNSFSQFCLELFCVQISFAQFCLELFCVQNCHSGCKSTKIIGEHPLLQIPLLRI